MLALPVALVAFVSWKRARYFAMSHLSQSPCWYWSWHGRAGFSRRGFPTDGARVSVCVCRRRFADLLETRQGLLVMAALCGLLIASAMRNLMELARAARP